MNSIYLNETAIQTTLKSITLFENEEIKIKHPGAFTAWCKENGFEKVNCECIKKGLVDKDPEVVKMANFARNFGHKECK